MKKTLLLGGMVISVLVLAGCGITDNQTSTTSKEKVAVPVISEKEQPEATKEPVKQGAKVEVVSHKEKASKYGASSIVGEVINNGDAPASYVEITATYYDDKGEVVDTGDTYAGNTADVALQPTQKTPFELGRIEEIKYANYKLDVSWQD
jgi:hypothetical protein